MQILRTGGVQILKRLETFPCKSKESTRGQHPKSASPAQLSSPATQEIKLPLLAEGDSERLKNLPAQFFILEDIRSFFSKVSSGVFFPSLCEVLCGVGEGSSGPRPP